MSHSTQRTFALEVVQKLRAAGFNSLWAGGCVRDQLLGKEPKDYDVATNATPEEIRDLFGHKRTLAIGAAFGVITVLGRRHEGQIEVATFRTDAAYSDGRHPDSVHFTTAEHDAQRRDFTINGLFFDPLADEVVDYIGGRDDLERKLVRAIGDPRQRLAEDKLRMLRAVRFAATFGFAIEPDTLCAIQDMAPNITAVSAERIGMEVRRMLVDPNRAVALDLLREVRLLEQVLPEVAKLEPAAWGESRRALTNLREPTLAVALAALLRRSTDPHAASAVGRRLRYTNREVERTAWMLTMLPRIGVAANIPWPELQRVLVHDGAGELLDLAESLAGPNDPSIKFCRERLSWPAERLNPRPLLDGADLIAHGLAPSPDFARLLEAARDAQLRGDIATSAEALVLVNQILAGGLDENA